MFSTDVILNEPWRLKRGSFEEKSVHKEELGERRKGRKSGVRRKEQYYNEKRQIRELQGRERKETGRVVEADQGGEKEWKSNVRLFGQM
jgi:hypothetical protein